MALRELVEQRIGYLITAYMVDDGKNVAGCERALDEAIDALDAERDRYRAALAAVVDPASSWNLADDRQTALMRLAHFVDGVLSDA